MSNVLRIRKQHHALVTWGDMTFVLPDNMVFLCFRVPGNEVLH